MSDLVKRLYNFGPTSMLLSLGFSIGDERNNEGILIGFANIPKEHGGGSIDLAIFGPRHQPFKVCEEAAEEIERLRDCLKEVREYFNQRADADQPSGSNPIPNEEMALLMQIDELFFRHGKGLSNGKD